MRIYDVALAWNWEHDAEFAADLERACAGLGLSFRHVREGDLSDAARQLQGGEESWNVLLDRAWESDPRFHHILQLAAAGGTRVLNPPDRSASMGNKAASHAALSGAGVPVPKQVDFMPSEWNAVMLEAHAENWRRPLWLKPACRGGGDGVLPFPRLPERFPLPAEWLEERFVLQESAVPLRVLGRAAWFRVFTVLGHIFPFWWDPGSHRFQVLQPGEEAELELACVRRTARAVGEVARLELFSTEIAVTAPGVAVAVDPVNDPVDLRRSSRAVDGIPDPALAGIVAALACEIGEIIRGARVFETRGAGGG